MKPDHCSYCVVWFQVGVKGHKQKFFRRGQFEEAVEFARELTLDDRFTRISIIENNYYYF